jgi:hypothetical protein
VKRKKNLEQKSKGAGSKNIKPDIWKRIGYEPNRKLVSQVHRDDYERRSKQPEVNRSQGSNERLKRLMHYY